MAVNAFYGTRTTTGNREHCQLKPSKIDEQLALFLQCTWNKSAKLGVAIFVHESHVP
jgi:hypothetical protein